MYACVLLQCMAVIAIYSGHPTNFEAVACDSPGNSNGSRTILLQKLFSGTGPPGLIMGTRAVSRMPAKS